MKEIWKEKKGLVTLTVILAILSVFAEILRSMIFGRLVDSVSIDMQLFRKHIVYTVALIFLTPIIHYVFKVQKNKMIYTLSGNTKIKLFKSLINENYFTYYEYDLGSKLSVLTNDMKIVEEDYFRGYINVIKSLILFLSSMISIFLVSYEMGLFLLVLSFFSIIIPPLIGKKIPGLKKNVSRALENYTARGNEYLSGYDTIRVYGIKEKIADFFEVHTRNVFKNKLIYYRYYHKIQSFTVFLGGLTFMGGFMFGGYLVSTRKITIGEMIICVSLSNHVTNPIYSIVKDVNSIKSVKKIINKFERIFKKGDFEHFYDGVEEHFNFKREIEFKDVEFSYNDGVDVLKDLNISFKKYKKYTIVGKSGAGKSTIINLLSGRLHPKKGRIEVDGIDLYMEMGDKIIDYISMIDRDVFLFKGTLRENITLYDMSYSENEILNALEMAGIANFSTKLDDVGFIKEDGKSLSAGERQRISIARAILKGAPILLADEILSAIDLETAKSIEQNLLDLEDRTLIFVTHRIIVENIKRYDEIIIVDDGRIVARGPYEEIEQFIPK